MISRRHVLISLGASVTGAVAGCSSSGDDEPANTDTAIGTPVHTYTEHQPNETEVEVETPNGTTTVRNETTPENTTTPDNTTTPENTTTPDNTTTPENTTTPDNTTTPEETVPVHDYEPSQINAGDIHAQRLEESKPESTSSTIRRIDLEEIQSYDTRTEQLTELAVQVSKITGDRDAAADAINYIALTELDWTNEDNFRGNHTRFYNGGPGDWTQLLYQTQEDEQKQFDAFSPQANVTDKNNMIQNVPEDSYFDDSGTATRSYFDKSAFDTDHPEWGSKDWEGWHENLHQVIYGDTIDLINHDDFIASENFEIGFTDAGFELLEREFEEFDGWEFLDHINEEYEKARQGVQEYEHALEDDEYLRVGANIEQVDDIEEAEFLYDVGDLEEWETGAGMAPSPS
ncbi:hypothetical protein Huta_1029 [Halorhabdus utahensis DSM 12940]|uniref:Uncharacterized protein n=1 Tax=Halorhabdus utahensis (strain DSM 12940 / JCM 11049 / AX-2) TaxID=519442 RepID=C7NVC8_HALUD|nr:hypothetical protein [Halorhabdus utahensis]ACV11212.1 hypothetical protein Huta_1029 [Halorhabdus utahensis DSM 12940]